MTQKLRKLIKIRNIAVIIALVFSCLSFVQIVVINSNGKEEVKELEQAKVVQNNNEYQEIEIINTENNEVEQEINIERISETSDTLKVNNKMAKKDEYGNYEVIINDNVEEIEIILSIITQGESNKTIDINNTGVFETPNKQVKLEKEEFEGKESIQIPIKIKENETITETTLHITFQKGTYISGRILTENIQGIYTADVIVYKISEDPKEYKEEVTRAKTNPDGTFKILAYMTGETEGKIGEEYEIVVTKQGYLDYTIKGIKVIEEEETILEEYKLIAGDIIKTGEIELDDLVNLNDRYGLGSEHPESDLNEDGVVDETDREIVKKNYTKKVEVLDIGTKEPSNLNRYITFNYSTTEWTNESVYVTIKQTAGEGYTLQYSTDKINWTNYEAEVEMSENGLIYARLIDNDGSEGSIATGKVKNIEKVAPTINTQLNSTEQTQSSIDVSINVSDSSSGLSKIIWYYKLSTESEYMRETTIYKSTGTGTTREMTKTKTISNLSTGKSYDIKAEVYDMAGNIATSDAITVETLEQKNVTLVTSSDKEPVEVPVPKGYVASSVESERTVNGGFVIYEGEEEVTEANVANAKKTRNQFVWIPVADASEMYWTDTNGEIYGTYYDFTSTGYTRRTRKCEPALVSFDSETYLGISREEFLKEMKESFNEMIESVTKYGGFYIGRYETGNLSQDVPVVRQMNTDISNQTWYTMYKKTKKISEINDNVTTGMIWGIQFDEVLKWLIDSGSKTNEEVATDSTGWGNYKNATFTYTTTSGGTSTKATNIGIRIPTGSSEYTVANNIYDIAGNVWECTMELEGFHGRYNRGVSYISNGTSGPAHFRSGYSPRNSSGNNGCRSALYIK